jgi:hypothetical protein
VAVVAAAPALVLAAALAVVAMALLPAAAHAARAGNAHSDPCHTRHTCPSDHHTYAWVDGRGRSWDCARPGASELSAADTVSLTVGGRRYLCHPAARAAGAAPSGSSRTGCVARGPYPDPRCSPGVALPGVTAATVCRPGYASSVRNVPASLKQAVYRAYGIVSHTGGQYEVDHVVSLELGGSNALANLYPEAAEPRPGFHEKDRVENWLHAQVCAGRLTLSAAQRLVARSWVDVYRRIAG